VTSSDASGLKFLSLMYRASRPGGGLIGSRELPLEASATFLELMSRTSRSMSCFGSKEIPVQCSSPAGVPQSSKTLRNWSRSDFPGSKGSPVISSEMMQPTDHTSIAKVYSSSPRSNSGGRYHNVITRLVYLRFTFRPSRAIFLANPKSVTFNS